MKRNCSAIRLTERVRRRRSDRKASDREQARLVPGPLFDVRAYRPEERLFDCHARARKLVEDGTEVPRVWESDAAICPACFGSSIVAFLLTAPVFGGLVVSAIALGKWLNPEASIGLLIGTAVISGLIVRRLDRTSFRFDVLGLTRAEVIAGLVFVHVLLAAGLLRQ
jgi:hypothetical protein